MKLFLSLLPIYIFGNLHCIGMCGPLVMLLAKHRYRWLYFWGRLCSFSLAALLAAEAGIFCSAFFPSIISLALGSLILAFGICILLRVPPPGKQWLARKTSRLSLLLSKLILHDHPLSTFSFGFCTVLLPCGQTLIVFSACALADNPLIGFANGFLFALLTSPSLIAAMYASSFFRSGKPATLF